jgi:ribosome-associated toxin RatA of RatAB toxin-antitoxin module
MPSVETTVLVEAPLDKVYALSRDIEHFPDFMEDVEQVTILEQTAERQVSRWVGNVKELRRVIRWTEEDFWNDQDHTCVFKQTEGDFTAYGGRWNFVPEGTGTRVTMGLDYEYNVPLVGALIQNILKKKMQANIDAMLAAIKKKAEEG